MPREISDEEYNALLARKEIADLVEPLWNDPALGKDAKRLLKRKYPQLRIPDLDIEDKVETALADDRKKRDDEKAAEAKEKQKTAWAEARAKTQRDYGFTDEAMKDLEKFMVEHNVASYEVAAGYQAAKNPKPSDPASGFNDHFWNHGQSDEAKEVAKDPEGWARKEIIAAIRRDDAREKQFR
jgi:hypothetical protein